MLRVYVVCGTQAHVCTPYSGHIQTKLKVVLENNKPVIEIIKIVIDITYKTVHEERFGCLLFHACVSTWHQKFPFYPDARENLKGKMVLT